jgi:hypothetical protein
LFEGDLNQVDLRLTKIFRIAGARFRGSFDIYNLFNASTVPGVNSRFGPQWLQATRIIDARLIKFGVQFDL